jgi:GH15 family glucan-1,4-alpha-glucosidase
VGYKPIENYGVIGDLNTVALVGNDGSIDFMAFPHFNAPTIFTAILDSHRGGKFSIAPSTKGARRRQLYLPDTNVLLTRFLFQEGVGELSDFMPVYERMHAHRLVREIKTVKGAIHYRMVCEPRFDYGRTAHRVRKTKEGVLFTSEGFNRVCLFLRTEAPLQVRGGAVFSDFTLRAGETLSFVLEEAQPLGESRSRSKDFVARSFMETVHFWRSWIGQSTYQGRWREMVNRSALILKLLTSKPYGSMVAAPTFGLPEVIGGGRNWDYRYTWIRDASFTLYALIRLGYTEEAAAFMSWIEARCADLNPDGSLQLMYGIDGSRDLSEVELTHLEGYRGSHPVRIGNDAFSQLQLDIYGELMDAVYLYDKFGVPISYDLWRNVTNLVDWVCVNWKREDEGIWEVRGGKREFLYSKLMCWVALDRAVRLAVKRSFPAPLDRWRAIRDEIYLDIMDNFWDPRRETFVQYRGSGNLDAANLLMPLVRFIAPTDPRWLSTLRAIEEELVDDSLVFRYRSDRAASDGMFGIEGTFSMCSFWYVECLSRSGDLEKARLVFEKALGYANHLGLYAEELGPQGEHLGNFPQAFTHLGLISAAYDLNRRLSGRNIA